MNSKLTYENNRQSDAHEVAPTSFGRDQFIFLRITITTAYTIFFLDTHIHLHPIPEVVVPIFVDDCYASAASDSLYDLSWWSYNTK